jgi:hypothetical protein
MNRTRTSSTRQLEVWILDDADNVAERIEDGCHLDPAADIFHRRMRFGPALDQSLVSRLRIGDAPECGRAAGARRTVFRIRHQAEFISADIEADVEWLGEIRLDFEGLGLPSLGALEVRSVVDDSPQAEEHGLLRSFDQRRVAPANFRLAPAGKSMSTNCFAGYK